jgi:hypothetical protein
MLAVLFWHPREGVMASKVGRSSQQALMELDPQKVAAWLNEKWKGKPATRKGGAALNSNQPASASRRLPCS